jgi:hypothetical protein
MKAHCKAAYHHGENIDKHLIIMRNRQWNKWPKAQRKKYLDFRKRIGSERVDLPKCVCR